MALRWWGGRAQGGRHSPEPGNGRLPLVGRLADEELGRAARDKVEIGDWQVAKDRFVDLCRGFGVVLDPATDGLDQLVRYVYRPLRHACFLTVKLIEDEVRDHLAMGVPLGPAFRQVTDAWLEDFGMLLVSDGGGRQRDPGLPSGRAVPRRAIRSQAYPPYSFAPNRVLLLHAEQSAAGGRRRVACDPGAEHQRSLRMSRRQQRFDACDVDFTGAGGREVVRVIFVTTLVVRDAVRSRVRKNPGRAFGVSYREVLDRYRAVTARLVIDSLETV